MPEPELRNPPPRDPTAGWLGGQRLEEARARTQGQSMPGSTWRELLVQGLGDALSASARDQRVGAATIRGQQPPVDPLAQRGEEIGGRGVAEQAVTDPWMGMAGKLARYGLAAGAMAAPAMISMAGPDSGKLRSHLRDLMPGRFETMEKAPAVFHVRSMQEGDYGGPGTRGFLMRGYRPTDTEEARAVKQLGPKAGEYPQALFGVRPPIPGHLPPPTPEHALDWSKLKTTLHEGVHGSQAAEGALAGAPWPRDPGMAKTSDWNPNNDYVNFIGPQLAPNFGERLGKWFEQWPDLRRMYAHYLSDKAGFSFGRPAHAMGEVITEAQAREALKSIAQKKFGMPALIDPSWQKTGLSAETAKILDAFTKGAISPPEMETWMRSTAGRAGRGNPLGGMSQDAVYYTGPEGSKRRPIKIDPTRPDIVEHGVRTGPAGSTEHDLTLGAPTLGRDPALAALADLSVSMRPGQPPAITSLRQDPHVGLLPGEANALRDRVRAFLDAMSGQRTALPPGGLSPETMRAAPPRTPPSQHSDAPYRIKLRELGVTDPAEVEAMLQAARERNTVAAPTRPDRGAENAALKKQNTRLKGNIERGGFGTKPARSGD